MGAAWWRGIVAGAITLATGLLGGWDLAIQGLLTFMALDYGAAVLRALMAGKWDSSVGLHGILRKLAQLIGVAVAHALDLYVLTGAPWARTLVCAVLLLNEAGSAIAHLAAMGVRWPDAVLQALQAEIRRKRGNAA